MSKRAYLIAGSIITSLLLIAFVLEYYYRGPSEIEADSGAVRALAYSPNGTILASGGNDAEIKLWYVPRLRLHSVLRGHQGAITCLDFSKDGTLVSSGSEDKTVRIWNVSTKECLFTLRKHTSFVSSVCFSNDGKMLVSGSWDKTIRLWDASTFEEFKVIQAGAMVDNAIVMSDGQCVASSQLSNPSIRFWGLGSKDMPRALQDVGSSARSVQLSPNGQYVVASDGIFARVWDSRSGMLHTKLIGHQDHITSLVISHDSTVVATASWDKTVKVWSLTSGLELASLSPKTGKLLCLAYSPDGKILAVGSESYVNSGYGEPGKISLIDMNAVLGSGGE
jgi:WD40 repeat protein